MSDVPTVVLCTPYLTLSPRQDCSMVEIAELVLQILSKDKHILHTYETVLYNYERLRLRKHPCASLMMQQPNSLIPRVHVERTTVLIDDVKQVHQTHNGSVITFRSLNPKVVSDAERQLEQQMLANCHCPAELRPRCYLLKWKHCLTDRLYCHYHALQEPIPRTWASCRFTLLL